MAVGTMDKKVEHMLKASDVHESLESIGWTEVLEPEILKYKGYLSDSLADAVLGKIMVERLPDGTSRPVSAEQIAGRLHGITWFHNMLKRIFRDGDKAREWLKEQGLNTTTIMPAE